MKGEKKVRKRKVGRPPKAPGDRARGFKLSFAGGDGAALEALAAKRALTVPEYIRGLVRGEIAKALRGEGSGPVTDAQLFEIARAALVLAEKCKAELKGGANV